MQAMKTRKVMTGMTAWKDMKRPWRRSTVRFLTHSARKLPDPLVSREEMPR